MPRIDIQTKKPVGVILNPLVIINYSPFTTIIEKTIFKLLVYVPQHPGPDCGPHCGGMFMSVLELITMKLPKTWAVF
jgi:hypothetical protein